MSCQQGTEGEIERDPDPARTGSQQNIDSVTRKMARLGHLSAGSVGRNSRQPRLPGRTGGDPKRDHGNEPTSMLTIDEVASYLKLHTLTGRRLAR